MKLNEDPVVQQNLSHVMLDLANGTTAQTAVLLKQSGFLDVLVGLIDSSKVVIARIALNRISAIACGNPEYRELLSQAGIVDRLIRTMQQSNKLCKFVTGTLRQCSQGRAEFATAKVGATVLSQLLATADMEVVDMEVVENACWALLHLLSGFKGEAVNVEEVNAVINREFVKPILKMLSSSSVSVQEAAIKCVHLITTLGDSCIQSITNSNGLVSVKDLLCSPNGLHEKIHKPACNAISNIIAGNTQRIQAAIDAGLMPSLVEMTSNTVYRIKRAALWAVYNATKGVTVDQVAYLVAQGGIGHLCGMLTADSNISITALWTLQNVSVCRSILLCHLLLYAYSYLMHRC